MGRIKLGSKIQKNKKIKILKLKKKNHRQIKTKWSLGASLFLHTVDGWI